MTKQADTTGELVLCTSDDSVVHVRPQVVDIPSPAARAQFAELIKARSERNALILRLTSCNGGKVRQGDATSGKDYLTNQKIAKLAKTERLSKGDTQ